MQFERCWQVAQLEQELHETAGGSCSEFAEKLRTERDSARKVGDFSSCTSLIDYCRRRKKRQPACVNLRVHGQVEAILRGCAAPNVSRHARSLMCSFTRMCCSGTLEQELSTSIAAGASQLATPVFLSECICRCSTEHDNGYRSCTHTM